MLVEFGRALVMVALHGGVLNRAVQALGGSVGSRLGRAWSCGVPRRICGR